MTVFDSAAEQFTDATDRAIARNSYIRGQLVMDLIARESSAGGFVLDYGCGPGRIGYLIAKAGFQVKAVDTSEAMIALARQLDCGGLGLEFETIDAATDVLQPNTYDAILCSSVIEYVPQPDELLSHFRASLRKPGLLIISYANRSSLWRRYWEHKSKGHPMYTPHNHTWTWRGFRTLLERHGFRAVSAPKFFDSPCDWYRAGKLFRGVSLAGSVGIVAARPI